MTLYDLAERLMAMDDAVWERHANPWSGWSRITALPLLALAVWSRVWLGWAALIPVALALVWIWANPRVFPPPADHRNWMSRGVLGERVFLAHRGEIPAHHRRAAFVLSLLSLPGLLVMGWGLWALHWEAAVFGTVLCILPKLWFVDRMVWLYEDWRRAGGNLPGLTQEDEGDV